MMGEVSDRHDYRHNYFLENLYELLYINKWVCTICENKIEYYCAIIGEHEARKGVDIINIDIFDRIEFFYSAPKNFSL